MLSQTQKVLILLVELTRIERATFCIKLRPSTDCSAPTLVSYRRSGAGGVFSSTRRCSCESVR
jgi:hypothetical protein